MELRRLQRPIDRQVKLLNSAMEIVEDILETYWRHIEENGGCWDGYTEALAELSAAIDYVKKFH